MDPLSIATGITGLISGITKLSMEVAVFIREVRDAQNDMNRVKNELETLTAVLIQIQQTDDSRLPPQLVQSLPTVFDSCTDVVVEMIQILQKLSTKGKLWRKIQWATSARSDIGSLRVNLEAHKSTLNLAIMISSTHSDQIILGEIALLQRSLPRGGTGFALQRFLEDTATYAGSSYAGSAIDDNETVVQEYGRDRNRQSFESSFPKPARFHQSDVWTQEMPSRIQTIRPSRQSPSPANDHNPAAPEVNQSSARAQSLTGRNERRGQAKSPTNWTTAAAPAMPQDTEFEAQEAAESSSWAQRFSPFKRSDSSIDPGSRFFCLRPACSYNKDKFIGYHTREELVAHMNSAVHEGSESFKAAVKYVPKEKVKKKSKGSRYFCPGRDCSYNKDSFLGWHTVEDLDFHMKSCRLVSRW